MSASPRRVPRPVVLLRHENGTGHIRADQPELVRCGGALTDAKVNWSAQLAETEIVTEDGRVASVPVVEDILFDDAVSFVTVARAVARQIPDCHAYDTIYDTQTPGPTVRYRRVNGAPRGGETARWLQLVDYGYEDGCWVFGHPRLVRRAAGLARSDGMAVYGDADKLGVGQGLAVDASCSQRLFDLLRSEGINVQLDIFRPDSYFDDESNASS